MIPQLVPLQNSPWDVLPPGVHAATFAEVQSAYSYNAKRRRLYDGLLDASVLLAQVGCGTVLLDGSYVTAKQVPGDFDACWVPDGMDLGKLDAVFSDFSNGRANQKARFGGEFFPSTIIESQTGVSFSEFFQTDRFTGKRKGILSVSLLTDPEVARRIRK